MSRTLTLIRHATANRGEADMSDFNRPLTTQGQQDAINMGKHLASCQPLPDLLAASPARRAKETAQAIAKGFNIPQQQICWQNEIYNASLSQLLALISTLDDQHQTIILVGHNPALSDLCNHLSIDQKIAGLPTCAVCQMSFDVKSWQQIGPNSGHVVRYEQP